MPAAPGPGQNGTVSEPTPTTDPPGADDGLRRWQVASGIVQRRDLLLLVANRRRNGSIDWSPPGGVIDAGETPEGALTREVAEETGLVVDEWSAPLYEITVEFADLRQLLWVQVFQAVSWNGALGIDDPDGIVTEVDFFDEATIRRHLTASPAWVADPVHDWLDEPWPGELRTYAYRATGTDPTTMDVERR